MTYHLYDHQRRHLAMSESLAEIQAAAADAFQSQDSPYGYIRWKDAGGQPKEIQVSAAGIASGAQPQTPTLQPGRTIRRTVGPRPDARRRATYITGVIIFLILATIAHDIAWMLMREP